MNYLLVDRIVYNKRYTYLWKEGAAAQQSKSCCRAIPMDKPTTPPCEEWAPKLAALHADDLSPADRAALEAHLASCPACTAALADYQWLAEQVRTLPNRAAQQELPPKLRDLGNTGTHEH
jgi:hypothetical protein